MSYIPGQISGTLNLDEVSDPLFEKSIPVRTRIKQPPKPKRAKIEDTEVEDKEDDDNEDSDEEQEEMEDEQGDVADDEQDERTVFVANVPTKLEESEVIGDDGVNVSKIQKALKREFTKYGKVISVRVRSVGIKSIKVPTGSDYRTVRKAAVLKSSLDERLDTCNAFIVFETVEGAQKAVENGDSTEFYGYHLRVDAVRKNSKGKIFERKKTVFVGNLVFEASEEECRKHFSSILGPDAVVSVRIVRDAVTNLGKGFAYILLKDEETAEKAINQLNETKIRTRAIRVTKCERSSLKKDQKMKEKERRCGKLLQVIEERKLLMLLKVLN